MTDRPEVAVVGGGIAGVAAAYYLAATHRVVLVEAADQLARHSTGRSAALYMENYGAPAVRPLTKATKPFLTDPPPGLADGPLVTRRGVLWIGSEDQTGSLDRIEAEGKAVGSSVIRTSPDEAVGMVPVLRRDRLAGGLLEPDPLDIDVASLHQAFVRGLRRAGGEILTQSPVTALEFRANRWHVTAGAHEFAVESVVNAAGAWGDEVASLAGVAPVGLTPARRTAFMVGGDRNWAEWPMVIDADHRFYIKPDGSQLLCSPADETPMGPCDVRPDPADVALAIERINEATTLAVRSVRSEWAGLRTFTSDRVMVIGPDPGAPGFVWLVGQGGTGIQTSAAAGELVASQIRQEPLPESLAMAGVEPEALAVGRLR